MNDKKRSRILYVADKLITPDRIILNSGVLTEGDKILAVGGLSGFSMDNTFELKKFDNAYITPGFIDTHIYGAGGCDCSRLSDSPGTLEEMSRVLGYSGVTGFFPSVVSDAPEKMLQNLNDLAEAIRRPMPGAEPLAINVTGPFINPARSGSQKAEFSQKVDIGFAKELVAAGKGMIKLMTFAPELENSSNLIEYLRSVNIHPSMGYSMADGKQTLDAIDAGANHCTHLFNCMLPLHQRDIGLAGVVLTDSRVAAELIIDGRHVHPRMIEIACNCKLATRIIGISNCTMAFRMPDGLYHTGPTDFKVENGYAHTIDGTLVGTTSMLNTGWHSLMSSGHLPETRAAQAVTLNPAANFDIQDRGLILPGRRADLAIFENNTNRLLATIRRGEVIYSHEK